jgi:hypothetical protein
MPAATLRKIPSFVKPAKKTESLLLPIALGVAGLIDKYYNLLQEKAALE